MKLLIQMIIEMEGARLLGNSKNETLHARMLTTMSKKSEHPGMEIHEMCERGYFYLCLMK